MYRVHSLAVCGLMLLAACAHTPPPREGPVVPTASGPVRGLALSEGGAAFLGIPYAAPPTGPLRWRPPQSPAPWDTPRDTTHLGPACPQKNPFGAEPVTSQEDCLHLNVWTPSVEESARRPVMVFIHGGGFLFGSNASKLYDGARLARTGVVVVALNYRLGALGFLAHPALGAEDAEHPVSGNYGLLDQQLALRWVRDNIAHFGGNPDNVTLFGESAGAISVCLQMLSPGASGLFHRAIVQSGTCYLVTLPLKDPGTPKEDSAEERGERFARELGCTQGDVLACMRSKSPETLLETGGAALDLMRPHVGFMPVVDGRVVPDAPERMLSEGRQAQVPLLLGTNADEGTLFTTRAKLNSAQAYEAAVRVRAPAQADTLLRLYPVTEFSSPRAAYNHLLRDALFTCPNRRLARTFSAQGLPVYAYHFTYAPPRLFSWLGGLGAFHAAELPFVFGATSGALRLESGRERVLSNRLIGYWTRFATHGDPNGGGSIPWPAYSTETEPHLVLDENPSTGERLDQGHCDALDVLLSSP